MTVAVQPPAARKGAAVETPRWRTGGLAPYLFILPHLLFFGIFLFYPFFNGFYISLFNYDFAFPNYRPFIGLQNYRDLFDPSSPQYEMFWRSVRNTLIFVLVSVPPMIIIPLGLAVLLNGKYAGRNVFRALFFSPWSLSVVVASTLWWWMFQDVGGLVNKFIGFFNMPSVAWLSTTRPVANWTAITTATVWWTVGFNTIILLAALQDIPESLYEAASIDGATGWQQFTRITLPLLEPVLLFVVTIQIIASFNLFGQPWIMTTVNNFNTRTVVMEIYLEGIRANRVGMAAAMSFLVALMMVAVTLASNVLLRNRSDA